MLAALLLSSSGKAQGEKSSRVVFYLLLGSNEPNAPFPQFPQTRPTNTEYRKWAALYHMGACGRWSLETLIHPLEYPLTGPGRASEERQEQEADADPPYMHGCETWFLLKGEANRAISPWWLC